MKSALLLICFSAALLAQAPESGSQGGAGGGGGGSGTVTSVACNGSFSPNWLTCSFGGSASVTPVLQLTPASAQSSHLVIGTCNNATSFGPCALVAGDLPSLSSLYLPITGGTLTGNLLFTDNLYDIGASGATRPRNLFLSSNITLGGNLGIGTSPPSSSVCASGTSMMLCGLEGTTPTGTFSAVGILWPNSATHRWNMINNAGSSVQIVGAGADINTSDQVTGVHGAAVGNSLNPAATNGSGQFIQSTVGAIVSGGCGGAITNLATIVLFGFQFAAQTCTSTTAFQGLGVRAGTVQNLRAYAVSTNSSTPGGGIVAVYKNGAAQALTCTLGTAPSCSDLTHTFSTSSNDQITAKVVSAGGTLTAGPTWSSGGTSCTNGSRVVTFSNNTSGINPVNATGTITVSGGVPTGAVTLTTGGAGYTAATPPTAGQVTSCTGTSTFTGGTVTVDALSGVAVSFEVF